MCGTFVWCSFFLSFYCTHSLRIFPRRYLCFTSQARFDFSTFSTRSLRHCCPRRSANLTADHPLLNQMTTRTLLIIIGKLDHVTVITRILSKALPLSSALRSVSGGFTMLCRLCVSLICNGDVKPASRTDVPETRNI